MCYTPGTNHLGEIIMTDRKEQTKAGATELSEEELNEVQGGFKLALGDLPVASKKPEPEGFKAGADLSKK